MKRFVEARKVGDLYITEPGSMLNQIKTNEYVYFADKLQKVIEAKPRATSVVLEHSGLIFDKDKLQRVVGVRYIHDTLPFVDSNDDTVELDISVHSMCTCKEYVDCGYSVGIDECGRRDSYGDYWIVNIETTPDNKAVFYKEKVFIREERKEYTIEDLKNKFNSIC